MVGRYGVRGGTLESLGLQGGALSLVLDGAGQTRAVPNLFGDGFDADARGPGP